MNIVKQSLLIGSGFAGGFLAGFVLSSCKETEAIREQWKKAESAMAKVNSIVKERTAKLREINDLLRKELSHPIPDLYQATESLTLSEEEIIYD